MIKKALFIVTPAFGHVSASFGIAKILKENGYKIVYFISNNYQNFVTTHGYDVFLTDSLPIGLNLDLDVEIYYNNKSYLEKLKDSVNETVYEKRKNHLLHAFMQIKPSAVFLDSAFTSADFIILYNKLREQKTKLFFIQTQLSSKNSPGTPYIDSAYSPEQTFHVAIEKIIRKLKNLLKRLKLRIIYLGYDDISMIYAHIKSENIPSRYGLDKDNYFYWGFKNIPEIITSPVELEFNNYSKKHNQHYLGLFEPESQALEADFLEKTIGQTHKSLVYISFGTQYMNELDTVKNFLLKIDTILDDKHDLIGILSLGNNNMKFDIEFRNIKICSFIPQVYLLKYCKFFITHGGLNSVKEAINSCVPMLVYPVKGDMVGTSRKVKEKGLGICGDLHFDSMQEIKQKFDYLIASQDIIRKKLTEFKSIVDKNYQAEKVLMNIVDNDGYIIH